MPGAGDLLKLPAPVVEEHAGVLVVRDDLIAGGTKARYLAQAFAGAEEVVYASPAYGGAQLALAYVARALGKRATIFVAKRGTPHPRTLEARAAGARVFQVPHGYLSHVQAKARAYAEAHGASLLPFGGEGEATIEAIAAAAADVFRQHRPAEVWSAAGSGVLTRGLQRGAELAGVSPRFVAVAVGRALSPAAAGRAEVVPSGVPFEREIDAAPPFPSCRNYDAKAWAACIGSIFFGAKPVLFWNVMGPSPTAHAAQLQSAP